MFENACNVRQTYTPARLTMYCHIGHKRWKQKRVVILSINMNESRENFKIWTKKKTNQCWYRAFDITGATCSVIALSGDRSVQISTGWVYITVPAYCHVTIRYNFTFVGGYCKSSIRLAVQGEDKLCLRTSQGSIGTVLRHWLDFRRAKQLTYFFPSLPARIKITKGFPLSEMK